MTLATVATRPRAAATPDVPPDRLHDGLVRARSHAPIASVTVAAAWWLLVAARLTGGRGPGATTGGAVLTAIALLVTRPDRVLPKRAVVLALLVSSAAFVVALSAPTGWAGASNAADYVCVAWTLIAVAAAVVRDARVVDVLLFAVVTGVVVEVGESWLAWWGGNDPTRPLVGTFFWWDPFAAYLIAGTVLGFAYFLGSRGPIALLGYVAFVAGSVGLVYSTSRAAGACFFLAALVVLASSVVRGGPSAIRRATLGVAGCAFVVWAIAGPPFFSHRALPFQSTAVRGSGQSLAQNGGYRMAFWRDAIGVFDRHPWVGGGFHSLALESVGHAAGDHISPLAHSGYLQALSDGGLLLAVPFLLACAVVAWYVVRALWTAVRSRDFSASGFVLPLVLGAMLLHSAVDFDWAYPADFAVVAVLAGLVLGMRWAETPLQSEPRQAGLTPSARLLATLVFAGAALLGVAAVCSASGDLHENLPINGSSTGSTS